MKEPQKVGRIALRVEGKMWNAYYAMPDTMEGALWLGSLAMAAAENPRYKTAFMNLMREFVGDIIKGKTGVRPDWNKPVTAKDSERSKS